MKKRSFINFRFTLTLDSPQLRRTAMPLIGSCEDDKRILLFMTIEGFVALVFLVICTASAAACTSCAIRKKSARGQILITTSL